VIRFSHHTLLHPVLIVLLGWVVFSCNESLPTYRDPAHVFSGELAARYTLTLNENSLKIEFRFTNVFDETLAGVASLEGSGIITLRRKPAVRKTFTMTVAHLVSGKYVPATRMLTIDPGDTVRLIYTWDFRDDTGNDLRTGEFTYFPDPTCTFDEPVPVERRIAARETFIISASLRVFDRITPVVVGPIEYSLCHVDRYVSPNVCPPILPELSCQSR
jgi:hypothetical protein